MGKSDSRPGPAGGLCIPRRRLDSGSLLPCPSRRVSQVPWRSLEYMPPPNTPGGPARRSCYPIVPVAGFPIQLQGRRRQSCNEAESSSLALRPALCLTFRPFPALLDASGYPSTPGRRLRGEQAITTGGISATRIARASPGAQLVTGCSDNDRKPRRLTLGKRLQGAADARKRPAPRTGRAGFECISGSPGRWQATGSEPWITDRQGRYASGSMTPQVVSAANDRVVSAANDRMP